MSSQRTDLERRRRRLRQRLRALSFAPLMRGSIVERRLRCGRAGCACAKDPRARHHATYLSVHFEGRTQVVHLRAQDEEAVRRAVQAYEEAWTIINGLTACELAELKRAARERRRQQRRRPR